MRILLVEDEHRISRFIKNGLNEEGYAVDISQTGTDALYMFDINDYDLVLLDIMIPEIDGIEVCRKIRSKNKHVSIVILTAKDSIADKVSGLDAGADDYITKPFSFEELSARIRANLRKRSEESNSVLKICDLELDPSTRTAKRNGKTIILTTKEYALLEYLMRHPNQILTKTQILEHVWDYNYDGLSNIVEAYIKYIRKKIKTKESDKELIFTMRGSGYALRESEDV